MSDLTITLTGEVAEALRKLLAEERYARPEDAVAEALEALEASRDAVLDALLRDVIAERAEAHGAEPSRALTIDDVRTHLFGR